MIISEGCAIESSDIGIAAELRWNTDPLPVFAQWKSMVSGDYVLGLEPSNCYIKGRNAERDIKNIGWIFKHTG
jgi:hypothetical protein